MRFSAITKKENNTIISDLISSAAGTVRKTSSGILISMKSYVISVLAVRPDVKADFAARVGAVTPSGPAAIRFRTSLGRRNLVTTSLEKARISITTFPLP